MYVLVIGAGQIGSQVIVELVKSRNEVVVIEQDPEVAEQATIEYDCLVINADATSKDVLVDAGGERADAVVCTTESDATNIMVLLLAQELEIPSLVSVVQNPDHLNIVREIGANIIENPQRLIAEHLVRAVQRPSVKDVLNLAGEAEIFEVPVIEDAPIAGLTLIEADDQGLLGKDTRVVAIERGREVLVARGPSEIQSGDLVTVFSQRGAASEVVSVFTGHD